MTWKPTIGDVVCTCRMTHVKIVEIDEDGDTIITEDGWRCSITHCCDKPDHTWSHEQARAEARATWP